ncbi:MAG: septum formation initiator family protein [Marinobacter sp.]|mgnify:CR=1 FL=1|uniref:septum formation initiator family protein n=1 Tax=Marinobacter sp. TaxID=50741 RepID=UPI0029C5B7B1|nr:septum formation initiator family protein [Marinobacter sp.]MDX5336583.1 septum formation initiator family protein [Marinobacter sp.]MDX5387723.1 septum formation initiator family protein [Marinobacter sp.]MDX5441499.1 septum formation initiator family protein [Alteromonadaceae bacterium]MDX5473029.1 septum formation initiator family protein [Marinobacter sp.]
MKTLWAILVVLILLLQVRLWVGEGSFAQVWSLEKAIAEQRAENAALAGRNDRLYAEVRNLRNEQGAVEERARMNLGLIREDETFFLVVEN